MVHGTSHTTVLLYIHRPSSLVVADFGCGEAIIAQKVPNKVHSFDLVAVNEQVTACDMSKVRSMVNWFVGKIKICARCTRRSHVQRRKYRSSNKNIKRFVDFIVKIRFYDYQTYLFEKFMRCAKVCGLFFVLDFAFRLLTGWTSELCSCGALLQA